MPKERLELSRCYHRRILNPLRLPVPPLRLGKARIIRGFAAGASFCSGRRQVKGDPEVAFFGSSKVLFAFFGGRFAFGRDVEGVFQFFAGFEGRRDAGRNLDFLAGLRVASGTSGAFASFEGTEADQGDFIPFFQGLGDTFEYGFERFAGLDFGNVCSGSDCVN